MGRNFKKSLLWIKGTTYEGGTEKNKIRFTIINNRKWSPLYPKESKTHYQSSKIVDSKSDKYYTVKLAGDIKK